MRPCRRSFPEKIEGLTFEPDLEDGRHLFIATNDSDFVQTQASRFFAFAIDRANGPCALVGSMGALPVCYRCGSTPPRAAFTNEPAGQRPE